MKIKLNQTFWIPGIEIRKKKEFDIKSPEGHENYLKLTKGNSEKSIDFNKGIAAPKITERTKRRGVIALHTNSFKENTPDSPWVDIIDQKDGWVIYNGDNKSSLKKAGESNGNKLIEKAFELYGSKDREKRLLAPPILIFSQENINGKKQGYRSFIGYGLVKNIDVRVQYEKKTNNVFTNYVFKIILFNLDKENGIFDWEWIDKRRDPLVSDEDTLDYAPFAWVNWVENGDFALDDSRLKIHSYKIVKTAEQTDLTKEEKRVLEKIYSHYDKKKHYFESLASLVAKRILGDDYSRGWITKRSGDGGVDFVGRLDIGKIDFGSSLVVLGQAKCTRSGISGSDLARVAARLQRGWMGIYVTTSYFTESAQKELHVDKYPIILANGKTLVQQLMLMVNEENITLEEIFQREDEWFEMNLSPKDPSKILD